LALPLAWVSVEYLRSVFPLDGFPWLILGYSLWRYPPLIQIADLTGVYGPSFLMAMGAGLLQAWVVYFRHPRRNPAMKPMAGTWIFAALLAGTLVYGTLRPHSLEIREGPVLAAVQGNIPQEVKDSRDLTGLTYKTYLDLTRDLLDRKKGPVPHMVVWPETVFPYPLGEGKPGDTWYAGGYGYSEALRRERQLIKEEVIRKILAPHGTWFLTGVIGNRALQDGTIESRNGAYLYDPSGTRKGVYSKTILVPGGEYLPFIDLLPRPFRRTIERWVKDAAGYLPDLDRGFGVQVMSFDADGTEYDFGVQICFENIYGDYCRRFIRQGADFLINISNEGWFKTSSEFDQMLAMSVFRAIESRRTLFRSTNTGISCVIGPEGGIPGPEERIQENGRDRAVQGTLVAEIPLCTSNALYTQVGDLFARLIFFAQIIFLAVLLFRFIWVTKRVSSV
jgi:apolipoprotein N-acyltransferase